MSAKVGLGVPVSGTLNIKKGREPSVYLPSVSQVLGFPHLVSFIAVLLRVLQRDRTNGMYLKNQLVHMLVEARKSESAVCELENHESWWYNSLSPSIPKPGAPLRAGEDS